MKQNLANQFSQFKQDFNKFYVPKQNELDEYIRNKKNISNEDWNNNNFYQKAHYIALKTEVGELVNECRDVWKYWKDKPEDKTKIIDEFVDVLHFTTLIFNKQNMNENNFMSLVEKVIDSSTNKKPIEKVYKLSKVEHYIDILGYSLSIMFEHYQFTAEDIKIAYGNKNNENYTRQQTGW